MDSSRDNRASRFGHLFAIVLIALAVVALHTITNGRYGYHRDELQTLDDARYLAWGYIPYPPLTPVLQHLSLALLGASLVGFRLLSSLAQGAAIVLAGLMTVEMGGKRPAQIVAAMAVAIVPVSLFWGAVTQYSGFDYLWWVLVAYLTVRMLQSGEPRWWLAIGAAIGLGMMTKYSMIFLVAGIVGGTLLTPARRWIRSPWLWAGAGLAVLIFLPNLVWLIRHNFVSLDFLRHIHARDVSLGRTQGFLRDQFIVSTNLFTVPLWLAGLFFLFRVPQGRLFRLLGWMFVIPFALFLMARGRGYYQAAAYPMLFVAGAVCEERWIESLSTGWARFARGATLTVLVIGGVIAAVALLPVARIDSPRNLALRLNGDLREEVGWPELVREVARVRDSLPASERINLGILAGNYGEAGAINLYGPAYGLPRAISGVNTFWIRGYGDLPPTTLIVVGLSQEFVERTFQSCRVAGRNANPYGIKNEEGVYHPDIFVCAGPRKPWPEFWQEFRYYG